MTKEADAMVHDFTLVYALHSDMGSQEDVLRQLAGALLHKCRSQLR